MRQWDMGPGYRDWAWWLMEGWARLERAVRRWFE